MHEPDPSAAVRTPSGATPPSGGLPGESPPFPVPDHTLIRRVGRGAYGEVWLARNALGTWRAVKFIRRSSFDDDRPFERELAGIQRFEPISRSHESQLNILHVGRAGDGFYYVMELADDMGRGQDIDEATYTPRNLRSELHLRGRLPAAECLRIGLALTTALEHLHKHGLVHRDIKPSNIVFVNGIPKLADIGLVARAEATASFVGTEGFLPPEGPGTRPADIYSLGKVLYEISTGHDRQQFPELPTNIVELPDRAELSELNEVLLKACHRDPKERYQTAAEMHADLALLESGRSVVRLRGLERRLRFVQRAGAAVTVIAALAAGLYLWQARQTRIVRNLAAEKSQLAEEKTKLADQNRQIAEEKTALAAEKSSLVEDARKRLVRLDIANGVRLMDLDMPPRSLLWFAEALRLLTNSPDEEAIHRIRIQQVLDQTTRPLLMIPGGLSVLAGAFSPDGRRVALASYTLAGAKLEMCDSHSGRVMWQVSYDEKRIRQLRFSRDGNRLFVGGSGVQSHAAFDRDPPTRQIAVVLDAQSGEPVFPAITENLMRSAFSQDGRWLAIARTNHVIELRDAQNGQLVAELKGHTDVISMLSFSMLSFSANSSLFASSSRDETVRLWRVPTGEVVGAPLVHDRPVARAVLSDDGKRLLTTTATLAADPTCRVQLWNTVNGQPVGGLTESNYVFALCFLPGDGSRFLLGADRFEVEVRDSQTLEPIYAPIKMASVARSWDFSPDGTAAVVGSDDNNAYVWDLSTGRMLYPGFRYTGWTESVQFSSDGKRLLTTSEGGTAQIWPLQTASESKRLVLTANLSNEFPGHPPRGKVAGLIPVEMQDGSLRLIDAERLVEFASLRPQNDSMKSGPWAEGRTGRFWATCEATDYSSNSLAPCTALVWELAGSTLTNKALPHPRVVYAAAFTPDDSRLVTACGDGVARIWRTGDGSLERTVPIPQDLHFLDLSVVEWLTPDASALLTTRQRGQEVILQLLDLALGQLRDNPILGSKAPGLYGMRFSPDATRLVSIGIGSLQSFAIFDLRTGDLVAPWSKHGGAVDDVDWSPDGKRLVSAGLAPWAKIWDATTGESLHSRMHIGLRGAHSARWSADGRFIFSRSDDNTARVWDASTTEALTPLLRHAGYIRWGCITQGNRLITASEPNLLRAWDLKPSTLPVDVIEDYARLRGSARLGDNGVLIGLQSDELAELNRSLRARAPQLFE